MRDGLTDDAVRRVLEQVRVIALVGASAKPQRASHGVGNYLAGLGYRVIGVNPGLAGPGIAGQQLYGNPVVARLADLGETVDMVEIFRRSEDVPPVVEQALALRPGIKVVWMQLGIWNDAAAAQARAAGATVVMDRCPAIEIPRLFAAGWRRG